MENPRQADSICLNRAFVRQYLPKIGRDGLTLIVLLLAEADDFGVSSPGVRYLKRNMRMGHAAIMTAISGLEQHGLIAVDRQRQPGKNPKNTFTLLSPIWQGNITQIAPHRSRLRAAR